MLSSSGASDQEERSQREGGWPPLMKPTE